MTDAPLFIDPAAVARLRRIGGVKLARDLITMYLELGPERIAALRVAVSNDDAAGVERAAHTMKSTAGNLGAVQLQQTAQQLETKASQGAIDGAVVQRLEREYEQAIAALGRILEELEA